MHGLPSPKSVHSSDVIRALIMLLVSSCAAHTQSESRADYSNTSSSKEQSEGHGQEQVFRKTIRVAERFSPDGGVASRVVTDTSEGIDRSFAASSAGLEGAETQMRTHDEAASSFRFGPDFWTWIAVGAGAVLAGLILWKLRGKIW